MIGRLVEPPKNVIMSPHEDDTALLASIFKQRYLVEAPLTGHDLATALRILQTQEETLNTSIDRLDQDLLYEYRAAYSTGQKAIITRLWRNCTDGGPPEIYEKQFQRNRARHLSSLIRLQLTEEILRDPQAASGDEHVDRDSRSSVTLNTSNHRSREILLHHCSS
jgi:hypothetical protein